MNRRSDTDEIAEIIVAYSTAGHFGHSREPPIASLSVTLSAIRNIAGWRVTFQSGSPPTPSDLELLPAAG
jgi:hypothetical protein